MSNFDRDNIDKNDVIENKEQNTQSVTDLGNPRKPQNEEGKQMLLRMNESHGPVTEWALSFFHYRDNDVIMDIGCGGGATLARISAKIDHAKLFGVDYSKVSVEMSKLNNHTDIATGKMQVLHASVEALPFEDDHFNKIVTVESFYFWPDPIENLKEVYRVLKKEGTFLLVADIYQKDGLSEETLENIRKYELRNPTKEQFREMFEEAGFKGIQAHTKLGQDWICVEGTK